jgi:hypothetical protein
MFSDVTTPPTPFGLSLPFDTLRMIGNSNRQNTNPTPFGLSLPFDRLRMIGNSAMRNVLPIPFGLSLPFDKLRMIGNAAMRNTPHTPFGLSLSKPLAASCGDGTSTGSVRTGGFMCVKFQTHPKKIS